MHVLAIIDIGHALSYVIVALLVTLFVMLFRNRLFVYRERELDAQNRSQTALMSLVLRSSKLRAWIYDCTDHRYIRLGKDGTVIGEYSPIDYSQFFERDDFEQLRQQLFSIRDGHITSSTLQVRGRRKKDKRQKQFEVTLKILDTDHSNSPQRILALQRDISAEKEKEEKVNQLLMQYHTVFNHSLVDMAYYDADGTLVDANEQACRSFGLSSRQDLLVQKPHLKDSLGFLGREYDGIDSHFITVIDLNKAPGLSHVEDHSNGQMYYEMTVNGIHDGEGRLTGIYSAGRNVTEMVEANRHQHEVRRQLKEANLRIHNYINNINYALQVSGVRMMNYYPDTHVLEIRSTLDKSQYELSQMRCLELVDASYLHHAKRILRQMDRRMAININQTLSTVLHDDQNRQLWFTFVIVPVKDANGLVDHYFGMCSNETEMIFTEQKLKDETQKAQETELLKNSFLMNMSYEIRTPLNAVLGFAELFNEEHDVADEPIFVSQIKENSSKLLELVNDVLFLSRLDAHMIEMSRQPTDFAPLFTADCQMGFSKTLRPDVKMIIDNPFTQLVVDIDEQHLAQVLLRLCTASAYHTRSGYVHAGYEYRHGELVITIENTDNGISAEQLSHVFERFATTLLDKPFGTGLALPISKELTEQMGGTLDITSKTGEGTSIRVSIPCEMTDYDLKT